MISTAGILLEALAPGFLVIGGLLIALPWISPRDERARAVMVIVLVILMWRYMFWRWFSTLPVPELSLDFAVGLIFVVIETLAVLGSTINLMFVSRLKDRSPDADRNLAWLAFQPQLPLVDVFICTYNEEAAILERTIVGALSLNYANKRVWVLDDGRRPWLGDLSRQLGANYLTRSDNAHAKAGNINNGLLHVAGLDRPPDFIAILDADFVPMPNFLDRTLSLFREKDVGIVQTPQHFINPDPLQSNLGASRVWPDEQRYFFDVVMASKDAWDAAFCCGTSSVIRFAPLWQVGGLPTWSVTEDYLLTLRLKVEGYRTIYLNERLSLGLAPEGLKEYITQRSRWALGFAQICRGPLGPLRLGNGLSLIDRISLIDTFLYWFASYAFRLLGIVIPILYWLLDVRSVQADVATTLSYYFPSFMAQIAIMGWMSQSRIVPIMSDVSQLLGASADHEGHGGRPVPPEGPQVPSHRQGRRSQQALRAVAGAHHLSDLPRPHRRRRRLGLPRRGRHQAARLERALPVLELVQYPHPDHRLRRLHRGAAPAHRRARPGRRSRRASLRRRNPQLRRARHLADRHAARRRPAGRPRIEGDGLDRRPVSPCQDRAPQGGRVRAQLRAERHLPIRPDPAHLLRPLQRAGHPRPPHQSRRRHPRPHHPVAFWLTGTQTRKLSSSGLSRDPGPHS